MYLTMLSTMMLASMGFYDLGSSQTVQAPTRSEGNVSKEVMLAYLKPILRSTGKTVRIYYQGACEKKGDYYGVSFPPIRALSPLPNNTGFIAIRDIFRNEKSVKVTEGMDGIIRIVIGRLPATILETKIHVLTFDQAQQYTESHALWRIQNIKEVSEAKRKIGISADGIPVHIALGTWPEKSVPHLPSAMTNLTMDQALDSVARTFGNIVFYGSCKQPHLYTIYYVSIKP